MLNLRNILCKKHQTFFCADYQRRPFSKEIAAIADESKEEIPASFENDTNATSKPSLNYDKSRLLPQHLRLLNHKHPYSEPNSWIHLSEKYNRKLYGSYGAASGVDPRICFLTTEDLINQKEYENIAYPHCLDQMIEKNKMDKEVKKQQIIQRENVIEKKIEKLETWKADLNARLIKKEKDAAAVKERKERLIEEVRRHFGFKVDPRDEKFKEMLEQKEKEDKKRQKEVKKKVKEDKMMNSLINMAKK